MTQVESKSNETLPTNFVKPYPGHPQIILGAMEHGRRLNKEDSISVTKEFLSRKHVMIDTAYVYAGGKSETYLGEMQSSLLLPNKALIATKALANKNESLSNSGIRKQIEISLKRLKTKQIDLYYLHLPDDKTPIEESLKCMNELYKEGKFKRLGLSNYSAWQVSEICNICKMNGYVMPSVYQGMYNCLTRSVELELFPCLRRYNIVFYAYNPLAAGILTGKHKYSDLTDNKIQSGRFHGSAFWPQQYRKRFWHKSYFKAVEMIKEGLKKHYNDKITLVEASMKWLQHHSQLGKDDGVILGAGTINHFKQNMDALENKEPFNEQMVKIFNEAWIICQPDCPLYFR